METGWGRGLIRDADGSASNNFFGIKADSRWPGAKASVPTLEARHGVMHKTRAAFRVYPDVKVSFDDYVRLVTSSARYRAALAHGGDPAVYVRGLQEGGYATDPNYAEKILEIFRQEFAHEADLTTLF